MKKKEIHIIGAGFAGLASAATLASEGYKVKVFEKNEMAGGRARVLERNGFRFDMGPTWYWMPDVFERFFARFGKKVSDYYRLKRLDPAYRVFFGKDDFIDVPGNTEDLYSLFESIEKGSAGHLRKFLEDAEYKYRLGINEIVYLPGKSLTEYLRWDLISGIFRLDVFRSVSSCVRKKFHSEKLRRILEFPVIFLGATPEATPALYTLMNYADLQLGTWYPEGGMFSVVEAMKKLAEEAGAEFYFKSNVDKIEVSAHKISGIKINNKIHSADALISAADYNHVEQELLPEGYRRYNSKYWEKRVMAPSGLLFYIGIGKKLKNLRHHNLFFDEDFKRHAEAIYETPRWPEKPALYVSCNSVTDSAVAPPGHENLIVLIPVAPGLKDDQKIREFYYNLALDRIEKLTGQEVKKYVVFKQSYAHQDFIKDYNAFKGNAYGLANTLRQTAFLKPSIRNPYLKNLFYTGQLTLPGPGVPPTIISGQVVAQEVINFLDPEKTKKKQSRYERVV